MIVKFEVDGLPQGKARPRFNTFSGRVYTPKKTVDYETLVRWAYIGYRYPKLVGPLVVAIDAWFVPPKNYSEKKKQALIDGLYATKKPDVDNIGKIVLDALNGTAYDDDSQVSVLIVSKQYGERARIRVTIRELTGG